jgi:hypothetical protein
MVAISTREHVPTAKLCQHHYWWTAQGPDPVTIDGPDKNWRIVCFPAWIITGQFSQSYYGLISNGDRDTDTCSSVRALDQIQLLE